MSKFNLKLVGEMLPLPQCDNRYGFDLSGFPQDSYAALLDPCDNGIVVLTQKGELFVNFGTRWFKAPWMIPTTGVVEAALDTIKTDPEAYLDDPNYDEKSDDVDWADNELEKVMRSFGWEPADPA